MQQKHAFKKLILPILLLLILIIPMVYFDSFTKEVGGDILQKVVLVLDYTFSVLVWLAIAWVIVRIVNVIIFDEIVMRQIKGPVPKLLKDVFAFIIFVSAIIGILNGVFKLPVTGLLATTGVIGMVIGFALKDMISDIFSGIAINIESPFKIGDVIELENGVRGIVYEINWRTTSIKPPSNILSIVPNGKISNMEIKNYSRPQKPFLFHLEFHLGHNTPTDRVLRVLTAAVKTIDLGIENKPDVHVIDVDEIGVKYRIRYWVPEFFKWNVTRTKVIACIMENLYHAGLTPVHPKTDLYIAQMPEKKLNEYDKNKLLFSRVELFSSLNDNEIGQLISSIEARRVSAGETIVRQHDAGSSLFTVVEGLLQVFVNSEDGNGDIFVGKIKAGESFGEFSLLTGEKRSATVIAITESVIYEIGKENIEPILKNRHELAILLSNILAERKMNSQKAIEKMNGKEKQAKKRELSNVIFEKMSNVFSFLKKMSRI